MNAPDADIRAKVMAELRCDPRVQDTPIVVHVDAGVVTLTGTVYGHGTRRAAQEAAHRVPGVRDVANDIAVDVRPGHGTDIEIAKAVRLALQWDARVPDARIGSTVANGWITLDGEVETRDERGQAERVVANIAGAQGVINNLRVTERARGGTTTRPRRAR